MLPLESWEIPGPLRRTVCLDLQLLMMTQCSAIHNTCIVGGGARQYGSRRPSQASLDKWSDCQYTIQATVREDRVEYAIKTIR